MNLVGRCATGVTEDERRVVVADGVEGCLADTVGRLERETAGTHSARRAGKRRHRELAGKLREEEACSRACTPAITTWLTPRRLSITSRVVPKNADQRFFTRYRSPGSSSKGGAGEPGHSWWRAQGARPQRGRGRFASKRAEAVLTVADAEGLDDLGAVLAGDADSWAAFLEEVPTALLDVNARPMVLSAHPDDGNADHSGGLDSLLNVRDAFHAPLHAERAFGQDEVVLRQNRVEPVSSGFLRRVGEKIDITAMKAQHERSQATTCMSITTRASPLMLFIAIPCSSQPRKRRQGLPAAERN